MIEILRYLKTHGERIDTEIAKTAGISLAETRIHLLEFVAKGEVVACHSTRVVEGRKTEGTTYRLAGCVPIGSPGRKSRMPSKLT